MDIQYELSIFFNFSIKNESLKQENAILSLICLNKEKGVIKSRDRISAFELK